MTYPRLFVAPLARALQPVAAAVAEHRLMVAAEEAVAEEAERQLAVVELSSLAGQAENFVHRCFAVLARWLFVGRSTYGGWHSALVLCPAWTWL